jgi:ATP-dependent protease ClpP protease subunit
MQKLLIIFILSLQSALASDAYFYKDENFSLKKLDRSDKTIVLLSGIIRSPMERELKKLVMSLDHTLPIELRLNSVGGSIYETQSIIEFLNIFKSSGGKIITRVDQAEICASSCVPLFVQGSKRVAGNVSSFMFHGVAVLVITNIPSEFETNIMLKYYREAGIQENWIQEHLALKVWSTPNETWYNGKELYENGSNFITDLLNNRTLFEPYNRDFGDRPR